MSGITKFEDIKAWQKARHLVKEVYSLTKVKPFSQDHVLKMQTRRAAISTAANIAEGFERDGNREFLNFLSVAKASSSEVRSHLYLALDQDYISLEDFKRLSEMTAETGRMIGGLMRYLKSCGIRGNKFK